MVSTSKSTVNPEAAGSSPVEPAIKKSSSHKPSAAPLVNVTENVTAASGRRVSGDFGGGIVHRPAARGKLRRRDRRRLSLQLSLPTSGA